MATKNLIPRGNGEGGIGIAGTSWGSGVFNTGVFNDSLTVGGSEVALSSELSNYVLASDFGTSMAQYVTVGSLDSDFGFGAKLTVDGNVGIGTAADPDARLEINSSEGNQYALKVTRAGGTRLASIFQDGNLNGAIGAYNSSDTAMVWLNTNGDSYFNGGNLGIGTTSVTEPLTVDGNILQNKTDVDGGNKAFLFNAGGAADEPTFNLYNKSAGDAVKITPSGIELSGIFMAPDENERIIFGESGIMVGQAEVRPDPDNPQSIYFQAIPQVKDSEGNAVTVLTADKLGLGTTAVLESAEQDLQFKLLTDQQRFVVGTTGDYGLESGWYRFNDFKVKGATDIGFHSINPVDTRIYSDESSFILFKTDTAGNRVAHLVGGEEEVSPNNAIALGIAVKVDSSEFPQDIEFVHTDGESYSVINGNSDSIGTNGLSIRQGFQPPSVGSNPAPLLIDGGSF